MTALTAARRVVRLTFRQWLRYHVLAARYLNEALDAGYGVSPAAYQKIRARARGEASQGCP